MPAVRPVLTAQEIDSLVGAATGLFGLEPLAAALAQSIGPKRAQALISTRKAIPWTKADTEALATVLWPMVPGNTSTEKRKAMTNAVRPCFAKKMRYVEVMDYVIAKIEEALAGPAPEPEPVPEPVPAVAGVDLSRAEWWGKSNEKAADWKVVGGIRIDNVNGSTFDIHQDGERLRGKYQVIAYFVWRDGRWLGGGFDGCGNEPFGFKRKTWGNAKTGVPGKHKGGNEQANRDKVKLRKGDAVVLCLLSTGSKTRTPASLCFEYPTGKEIDPATLGASSPQDVPDADDGVPVGTFTPPARTGEPSYVGKGDINKWLEIAGDNPRKSVSLSCWIKFNGWPRRDVGAHLINKGKVGLSWAFGLCVKPNELVYKATKGDVAAAHEFKTGRWYHVRIDATKSSAKFWVDGKPIKVTRQEVSSLFDKNNDPVRIGGHTMDWTPPSSWYNGSLDGEMCDWKVETK